MFKKGNIPWNKDIPRTEEEKINISNSLRGRHLSERHKKKIGHPENQYHLGILHTEKTKRQISKTLKGKYVGDKNWNWQGGKTLISFIIRNSFRSRQWRDDVFTRDEFTCQECGQVGGRLNAHHIKPFASILRKYEIITIEEALECEELWSINNGITLCEECHSHKPKKIKI